MEESIQTWETTVYPLEDIQKKETIEFVKSFGIEDEATNEALTMGFLSGWQMCQYTTHKQNMLVCLN